MNDKTVLITGASSGIGKETAKQLAARGYRVYAAARRIERMADLERLGCVPLRMDVTKEEDLVAAIERIREQRGGVDVLINNAGFGTQGSIEETSLEDARYQFDVNLFGLARLTQLVLPHMRENRFGKIVNVSSVGGKIYVPLGGWYHATKHALEGWSDCLRTEVARFGIDVVIVEPGAIGTEFNDVFVGPMLERSGDGPYKDLAHGIVGYMRDLESKPDGSSPPSVIADVIVEALEARRPKTRYVAGRMAKSILFARRWLSDRMFDRMIGPMIG
ncbi:MAG: oxidoreductase [Proteobacteria bacterium]|nr:oxidoreductase [Pseudomonadota bacterium]